MLPADRRLNTAMDLSEKLGDDPNHPKRVFFEPMAIKLPKRHPGEYLLRLDVLAFFGYGGPNNTLSHLVFGCLGMEHHHVFSKGITSTQMVVFLCSIVVLV